MFNENSGLVKIWLRLIQSGQHSFDEVPNISNLREVVYLLNLTYRNE